MSITRRVRDFWEAEPCGTGDPALQAMPGSPEWFAELEARRYELDPHIPEAARFGSHLGTKVLEIGVGAGTDHVRFARGGAAAVGLDLTSAGVEMTARRLRLEDLTVRLAQANAEVLPVRSGSVDLVYSWGVLHHAENPPAAIDEVQRVLRPGGRFIGMLYARWSMVALLKWGGQVRRGRFRGLDDVISTEMESVGTRCYNRAEVRRLFGGFASCEVEKVATAYDREGLPQWARPVVPAALGWNLVIDAVK